VIPIALPGDEQDVDARLRGHDAGCAERDRREKQNSSARIPHHVIGSFVYGSAYAINWFACSGRIDPTRYLADYNAVEK
jgi:hypothetical protein